MPGAGDREPQRWVALGGDAAALTMTAHIENLSLVSATSLPPCNHAELLVTLHSRFDEVNAGRYLSVTAHETALDAFRAVRRSIITHLTTFHHRPTRRFDQIRAIARRQLSEVQAGLARMDTPASLPPLSRPSSTRILAMASTQVEWHEAPSGSFDRGLTAAGGIH